MKFESDSGDYHLLENACEYVAKNKIPGAIVEIGTRRGGSAAIMADKLAELNSTDREFIVIDPYGNIGYIDNDDTLKSHMVVTNYNYSNEMRDETIPDLHKHIASLGFNFMFMNMEDSEFFSLYPDGTTTYNKGKRKVNQYAIAFIDGPHHIKAVMETVVYFEPKIPYGGLIIFDNIDYYNHNLIEAYLLYNDFIIWEKTSAKASYLKIQNEVVE